MHQREDPDHGKIFSLQRILFCFKQNRCFSLNCREIPVRNGLVEINPVVNDIRKRRIAFGCPDNDGVDDVDDAAPLENSVCRDVDSDTCDDCSSGTDNVANDGTDTDADGACDAGDIDDDNDGLSDVQEAAFGTDPLDPDTDDDGVGDVSDSCPLENATGFDANDNGCIDNFAGLTDVINTLVTGGIIDENLANPLITKVENAEKSATKDNICAAVNQLEAFKNQIEAKRGNPLSDEVADKIIQYTNNIIFKLLVKLPEGESCT